MATVIPDLSPADLLARFRGTIHQAVPGYPEVVHLRVRDVDGGEWALSTFYAEFSPSKPDILLGKEIVDVRLEASGRLTLAFSDRTEFVVVPGPLKPGDSGDDLETWHLFTPEGLALFYGPGPRWELGPAGDLP